jgi:vacuole morphology and inheritance protein 14
MKSVDAAIARQLVDKIYEKRKAAALDLEKSVIECSCGAFCLRFR